jgi:nicotinate-nucleotide--dimethylbenzimidazole phosphoribosyltransferase
VRQFPVTRPAPVHAAVPQLGRLAGPVRWLAAVQGTWPPHPPRHVDQHAEEPGGPAVGDGAIGPAQATASALEVGAAAGDAAADAGADLLLADSCAPPAAALAGVAALLHLEPVAVVGTGGGAGWAALLDGVREGLRRARPHLADPAGLVLALADPALGRLVGLLAQCAVRRTPVVLGSSSTVAGAALIAERLAPGGATWWLAGDSPVHPGARRALADLGLDPLLDLRLATGGARPAAQVLLAGVELVQSADG